ncbi:hypothetical protein DL95DRAFT_417642 [Leptodontidium sp. 2 PMI_412]|nr:hypothetical protein DL95DRAFT_417642 [Leptodontidium sp. 2 PMI_412]
MDLKFNRKTRFPSNDQGLLVEADVSKKNANLNRRTRFPGGTDIERIRLLEKEQHRVESYPEKEQPTQPPFRLPIRANPPDMVLEKPVPKTNIEISEVDQLPPVRVESPWNFYISLRHLERGGQVTVAYTRKVPVRVVVIKELVSHDFLELRKCQHENLLAIMEVYRFQGVFFIITDYTAATLKQIIAIPLPLEERHVSATCRLVHPSSSKACSIYLGLGIILTKWVCKNSLIKAQAHFDECRTTESAAAWSLGVIAIEMMQNGIPRRRTGSLF